MRNFGYKRAQVFKNRFLRFLVVYGGFSRFLVPDPQIKNLKIDQKIDFPKIVPKHVLMANMGLKHV